MQLALLIDERDQILEHLEIAETKYIQSFRLTTPDPSIADWVPPTPPPKDEVPGEPAKPQISRPRPLMGSAVGLFILSAFPSLTPLSNSTEKAKRAQSSLWVFLPSSNLIRDAFSILQTARSRRTQRGSTHRRRQYQYKTPWTESYRHIQSTNHWQPIPRNE